MTIREGLGVWILPQPVAEQVWVAIPKFGRTIPFGYRIDDDEPDWLQPIQTELEALEKAKKFISQYSSRQVAAWLTKLTGRTISHVGLLKRIKNEQSHKRKSTTYSKLADRYEKALKQAKAYDERLGTNKSNYFDGTRYNRIKDSFTNNEDGSSSTATSGDTERNLSSQSGATD